MVEALLVVALVVADPGLIDRRSTVGRAISLLLVVVLVVGRSESPVRPVTDLIEGGPETKSASAHLGVGPVTNEPGSPQHQPRRTSSLPCLLRLSGTEEALTCKDRTRENADRGVGIT